MIIGSIISGYLLSDKKNNSKWLLTAVGIALFDILICTVLGELASRLILGHRDFFAILMIENRIFRYKFVLFLFLLSLVIPFTLNAVKNPVCRIYEKTEKSLSDFDLFPENASNSRQEKFFIFFLSVMMFTGILIGTGSLFSGFHFQDDFHSLCISEEFAQRNLFQEIIFYVKGDLSGRFRPLFWIAYVMKVFFLGENINNWMILTMIEGIITFQLLYYFCKNLGCSKTEALLFTIISVFGEQFMPWYRIGTQENAGYLYYAAVLFLLSIRYKEDDNKKRMPLLYVMILLSSLQKEAFVVAIPGYLFLGYGIASIRKNVGSIFDYIKKEWLLTLFSLGLFFFEIGIIVFCVGTNQVSYAGFSRNTSISDYLDGIKESVLGDLKYYMMIILLVMTIYILWIVYKSLLLHKKIKADYSNAGVALAVYSLYIMSSQLVIYAKSSMFDRYMIPFIVGWSILFVVIVCKRLRKKPILYLGYLVLLIVLGVYGITDSISISKEYAIRGHNISQLLNGLKKELDENPYSDILVYIRGEEPELALMYWEEHYSERDHQYNWTRAATIWEKGEDTNIEKKPYDYIATHYANYYCTDYLHNVYGIDRDDYDELFNTNEEYALLKHK